MPPLRLIAAAFGDELEAGFATIREQLDVPADFPESVREAAERAARNGPNTPPGASPDVADRTDLPLVTIDPPPAERRAQRIWIGHLVHGITVPGLPDLGRL